VNENALKLLEILKGRGVKLKIVKNEQRSWASSWLSGIMQISFREL